jgi:hypothetical protein
MNKEIKRNLIWVGIFAAAMAFVEAMAVYYLRKIYYPGGVLFPINLAITSEVIKLEWVREIATIIMLLAVAFIAARKFKDKFAYFIYAFAVWDIFYYIWLKVALNWPAHLMDWDILFLIPTIWASPWIIPVIISIIMIILAFVLLKFPKAEIKPKEWTMLIVSAVAFLVSFVWDYAAIHLANRGSISELTQALTNYVPTRYKWWLFVIGIVFAGLAICSFWKRAIKRVKN